jgi:stearoyl-CoA desaturase (delta-9 desaturase)
MFHLFQGRSQEELDSWLKLVPDLKNDRYYHFLNAAWIPLSALVLVPLYWAGGVGYVLWGGVVRIVLMLHFTWFVNSACHMWGYRNYNVNDRAMNSWWVALLAAGEGWHNNHHAHPYSATNRHRWWEFDFTYGIIWVFERLGLATHVRRPRTSDEKEASISTIEAEALGT